ncbi:MAG: hypothetical protein Q9200_000756 [Gallowayella weberi]
MEAISVEIDLVVREKIKHFNELRRYHGIDDSAHEALSDRLGQVENRTYLWAALIFPELERCAGRSKRMLLDIINSIPTTVNEAYENILSRSSDMQAARKLLRIVLGAPRPLTLDEMNVALSIDDCTVAGSLPRLNLEELIIPFSTHDDSRSIDQLDLESATSFRTTVRDLCGLFVSVRDSKIYLIYQTAREFLLSESDRLENPSTTSTWHHSLNLKVCKLTMARICLAYLSFSNFEASPYIPAGRRGSGLEKATKLYLEDHPFLELAARFWPEFAKFCYDILDLTDWGRMVQICRPKTKAYQTWFQIRWSTTRSWTCYPIHPKGFNEFSLAVYLQLIPFAVLVNRFVDVDAKDSHSRSALWWALEKGLEEEATCVMMDYMEFDYLVVLQMAAILGRATVVEYILSNANISGSTKASDGWGASQRAAVHGHVGILERLERFETSSMVFELDETALYEAAADMSEDMTRYPVLDHVKSDSRTSDGETLLYRCIANRKTAVAKVLLRSCADIDGLIYNPWNADGYRYGETLLYRAASELDKTMVFMLLERGAEVEAKSRLTETALYRVACRTQGDATDQADIAKLLIERGADVSQNDDYFAIIKDSGLIDMECFKTLRGPNEGKVYEQMFWNISTMINRVRDDM